MPASYPSSSHASSNGSVVFRLHAPDTAFGPRANGLSPSGTPRDAKSVSRAPRSNSEYVGPARFRHRCFGS